MYAFIFLYTCVGLVLIIINVGLLLLLFLLIVDFVLRDPRKQIIDVKEMSKEMKELDVVPQPWRLSLLTNKDKLQKTLCLVNPCIRQAVEIWFSDFV